MITFACVFFMVLDLKCVEAVVRHLPPFFFNAFQDLRPDGL